MYKQLYKNTRRTGIIIVIVSFGSIFGALAAPASVEIDVGPYVQFTGTYTAVVRWDAANACDSIVEYGQTNSLGRRVQDSALRTNHEITLSGLDYRTKYYYRIGNTTAQGEVFSDIYTFDNAINYTRMDCSDITSPYSADSLTALYEAAAERIVSQTPIKKGYCLVYGSGRGRLAFELAKRTDMIIVGVDTDSALVEDAVNKLMSAGVYGARVKIRKVDSLDSLPFSRYFFNLIVSDRMLTDGTCPGSSSEMYRVLRPDGGIAYFGQPAGCPNPLAESLLQNWLNTGSVSFTIDTAGGLWSKTVRPVLAGAGQWLRQYGGTDNAAYSGDNLMGATGTDQLTIQWLGSPGADFGADRNPRMPAPVMANGRLYHTGLNRIMAIDSYNGSVYWSLEIPGSLRVNTPRDGGYYSADGEGLFVAIDDDCWRLDGGSGFRTLTAKLGEPGHQWGYVALAGDKLYGSAQYSNAYYTDFWGAANWYDATSGAATYKVCSRYLFACGKTTGQRVWTDNRPERGVVINSTITIGNGRIYFVESRDSTVKSSTTGRIGLSQLWLNQYLVALNADTGAKLWEQPIDTVDGIVVFYMLYSGEKLFIMSSGTTYNIYAYNASGGGSVWSKNQAWTNNNHGGHMQHPVIVGGTIYLEPNGYNINTGDLLTTQMGRHGGCATYAGTAGALIYRGSGGKISLWDTSSNAVTQWTGLRPSCWLSTIAGGGMVLSPEGGGGCSCNGWINTSVGFIKNE